MGCGNAILPGISIRASLEVVPREIHLHLSELLLHIHLAIRVAGIVGNVIHHIANSAHGDQRVSFGIVCHQVMVERKIEGTRLILAFIAGVSPKQRTLTVAAFGVDRTIQPLRENAPLEGDIVHVIPGHQVPAHSPAGGEMIHDDVVGLVALGDDGNIIPRGWRPAPKG